MVRAVGLICVAVVIALDGVAVYLGVQADSAQDQGRHGVLVFECQTKGHHRAYVLGLEAALALALAHLLPNLVACAACRCSPAALDTSAGKLAALFLAVSWLACGFGLTFYIQGAFHNKQSGFSCGIDLLKKHLLMYGVVASLVHGATTAIFCLLAAWIGDTNRDTEVKF